MTDNSDSAPENQRRHLVARILPLAIFFVLPAALVGWCLTEHILERSWWRVSGVVGVSLIAAIAARHLGFTTWMEAIPVWGTTAILICVALSMYADYSKREVTGSVDTLGCSSITCPEHAWPNKALLPTPNPLSGLSAAELGR